MSETKRAHFKQLQLILRATTLTWNYPKCLPYKIMRVTVTSYSKAVFFSHLLTFSFLAGILKYLTNNAKMPLHYTNNYLSLHTLTFADSVILVILCLNRAFLWVVNKFLYILMALRWPLTF